MSKFFFVLFCFGIVRDGRAQNIEFKADQYTSDFENGKTNADGHVELEFEGMIVRADKVEIDNKSKRLIAHDNVYLEDVKGGVKVWSEKMEWDLISGFGRVYQGKVNFQEKLLMEGHYIERYAKDRYLIRNGKVSSCFDCPQSWSLAGLEMDVQTEGYARVEHALVQVMDQPIFYFPYLLVPVKNKRQSGVLFPEINNNDRVGTGVEFSYFWARNEHSDVTFHYMPLTSGAQKIGQYTRYLFSDRSFIDLGSSYVNDPDNDEVEENRFAARVNQKWQINSNWSQRYRGEYATDPFFGSDFAREFSAYRLPVLDQDLSVSWQNDNYFSFSRLVYYVDGIPRQRGFLDPNEKSIARMPEVLFSYPSQRLWNSLLWDYSVSENNFVRSGSSRKDPLNGWYRTGSRTSLESGLYLPANFGYFLWEGQVMFRGDFYQFPLQESSESASRMRYRVEQKLGPSVWNTFDVDGWAGFQKIKHVIRPTVRWSYAGRESRTSHPFFGKMEVEGSAWKAPQFDVFDPESPDIGALNIDSVGEEQLLGEHHLVIFAVDNFLVGRSGEVTRQYARFFDSSLSRNFDLRDEKFGPIRLSASGSFAGLTLETKVVWDTENHQTDIINAVKYRYSDYSVGLYQTITNKSFDNIEEDERHRFYGLSTEIRNIGPMTTGYYINYNGEESRVEKQVVSLFFDSQSRCWKLGLSEVYEGGKWQSFPAIKFSMTFYEMTKEF